MDSYLAEFLRPVHDHAAYWAKSKDVDLRHLGEDLQGLYESASDAYQRRRAAATKKARASRASTSPPSSGAPKASRLRSRTSQASGRTPGFEKQARSDTAAVATTYYSVLQVTENAELEVIEAAYRRLARKYHPDASDRADATQIMQ